MSRGNDRSYPAGAASTLGEEAPPPSVRDRAILTAVSGDDLGRVLTLPDHETVTVGRGPDCTHRFTDATISLVHAQVGHDGPKVWFRDVGSKNGSAINDVEAGTEAIALSDGDRVRCGPNLIFRFSFVDVNEETALQQLYEAAQSDPLTGIFNRKYLDHRIESEIAFAARHAGSTLSLLFIDLDHFKEVNDGRGHLAGDAVLRHVAIVLKRALRTSDVVARFGGEEFVILLRGVDVTDAVRLAERLRRTVEESEVPLPQGAVRVTTSVGVSSLSCCPGAADREKLLAIADARLYAAKQAGRNRVVGPQRPRRRGAGEKFSFSRKRC